MARRCQHAGVTFSPNADDLLARNRAFAEDGFDAATPSPPSRNLAVVACMDSRLDVERLLGLEPGDAHVLRNAGGVVTDDVIRSLTLSQRALGTREVVLVHHTRCGLAGVDEAAFRRDLQAEIGVAPTWSVETFDDVEDDVRQSMARVRRSPFLPHTDHVRGFVYDVDTGLLHEVD